MAKQLYTLATFMSDLCFVEGSQAWKVDKSYSSEQRLLHLPTISVLTLLVGSCGVS